MGLLGAFYLYVQSKANFLWKSSLGAKRAQVGALICWYGHTGLLPAALGSDEHPSKEPVVQAGLTGPAGGQGLCHLWHGVLLWSLSEPEENLLLDS